MTQSPDTSSEQEFIDTVLGICATYGTTVLGTKDQEHFIAGFKHSKTYAEARAALEAHIATVELEARIDEVTRYKGNFLPDFRKYYQDPIVFADKRLEQLEDQKGKQ